MRRQGKFFIEQFPMISAAFSTSFPTGREYKTALSNGKGSRLMSVAMLADDLLRQVASHREATDLFGRYGFASRRCLLSLEMNMPTRKQEKTQETTDNRAEWKGFLDFRLDSSQLDALDAWKPKPAEVFEMVEITLQQGYKFTLSYNKQTKVATCTLIDSDPKSRTGGYGLASGDTDGASALKMAVYKQHILLENDWSRLVEAPPIARRG